MRCGLGVRDLRGVAAIVGDTPEKSGVSEFGEVFAFSSAILAAEDPR
jgi:hypothetical protein